MKFLISISLALLTLAASLPACTTTSSPTTLPSPVLSPSSGITTSPPAEPELETLRLVGTIGPLCIPLAYLQKNNRLASVAKRTSLDIWATPTQLQAIMASGQADFISLPSNAAATFYNKGISLQLLDTSIWNILYVVSSDQALKAITDLNGKRIVAPYQGALPDAMLRFVLQKAGINPDKDLEIYYAADPVQASQLLLSGQERYGLLSEPSATQTILKAQSSGNTLYRSLNMRVEWERASGGHNSSPIAGTAVLGEMENRPAIISAFIKEYSQAVEWMLANPGEAGQLGAAALSQQGFSAEALTESLKNIDWRFTSAQAARADLESFFKALAEINTNYIGGKLPDSGFYYGH